MDQERIELVPVLSLPQEMQMEILAIRNEEGIRKWMYTNHIISPEEHQLWLNSLYNNNTQKFFAITRGGTGIIGVVYATQIDSKNNKCNWGFYLTSTSRGGIGSVVELYFIDYIFEKMNMAKLNCEVIEGNDGVIKLHEKFGFQREGFRRENIVRSDGLRVGVHLLGITRDEWIHSKSNILERYKAIFAKFSVSMSRFDEI